MTANILVVDDLEQNVKVLEIKLLQEYYTVFSANSGISALKFLEQNKIDVVLLDVMMPGMDGFEVCSKIKSNHNRYWTDFSRQIFTNFASLFIRRF